MNIFTRVKSLPIFAALTLTVFMFVAKAAAPSSFSQQARLVSGAASDDYANTGVGISGDTAVVASGSGFYIFTRSQSTWSQQTILVPSDGLSGCGFPFPVAIEGDTVVAGCPNKTVNGNANQGAAYVFARNGANWTEQQRLLASDASAQDRFGGTVAISGGTIVVGAVTARVGTTDTEVGAAYVFVRSGQTWSQQAQLLSEDVATLRNFGSKVTINGDNIAVTRSRRPTANPAVYVFVRAGSTWQRQQILSVCESSANNLCRFGDGLALRENTLVIGNPFLNINANIAQGGAYVFLRSGTTWTQQQRLTAADGGPNDYFGVSLAVDGQALVAGAHADLGVPGKVYIHTLTGAGWAFEQKLMPGLNRNAFGQFLSLDGNSIIIAAPVDAGSPGTFVGAAYVFTRPSQPVARGPFDFDGDGKTDIGIFRPIAGASEWWVNRSSNGQTFALQFGSSTDVITPADYTGDGKTDIAFFRPTSGEWFVLRSEDFSFFALPFGTNGDVPAPADYDADGKADFTVFRPSSATWFISQSSGAPTRILQFGVNGDKPVVSDYDGDGKADVGVIRSAAGAAEWWIQRSTAGLLAMQFGASTDKAVAGDYTGDGKTDAAVWRPSTGEWLIVRSEDFSFFGFPFGTNGDVPSPGDYDGDGKFDATVFRPSSATWFIGRSTAGTQIVQFGSTGDRPIPNAFVP